MVSSNLINIIKKNVDEKTTVHAVYTDMTKALEYVE